MSDVLAGMDAWSQSFGAMEARELKPGGEGINVTQDNKQGLRRCPVTFLCSFEKYFVVLQNTWTWSWTFC
jgi:hypothetical protein